MEPKKFYTLEEVADILGFKTKTIRGFVSSGILEAVKFPREYRVTPEQIENYVKKNTTGQKNITAEDVPTNNE